MLCTYHICTYSRAHTRKKDTSCDIARPPAVTAGKRGLPRPTLPLTRPIKVTLQSSQLSTARVCVCVCDACVRVRVCVCYVCVRVQSPARMNTNPRPQCRTLL